MINGVPDETPQHVVGAITTFVATSTGLIVLSRRLRADTAWADLSDYVLATGRAMLLLFVILGAFSIDEGTPLHAWAGLLQRVVVVIWFSCLGVLSWRLRRVDSADAHSDLICVPERIIAGRLVIGSCMTDTRKIPTAEITNGSSEERRRSSYSHRSRRNGGGSSCIATSSRTCGSGHSPPLDRHVRTSWPQWRSL
jgi:hypothetical protein